MLPDIVVVGVGRQRRGSDVAPPRRRLQGNRIERDAVARRPFASPGNVEGDGRFSVDRRELEASLVEMKTAERACSGGLAADRDARVENGVTRELVPSASTVGDRATDGVTEELANCGRGAGAEIKNPTTRGVPRIRSGHVDIDVVLEGDVRSEHAEHVDL